MDLSANSRHVRKHARLVGQEAGYELLVTAFLAPAALISPIRGFPPVMDHTSWEVS